MSPFEFFILHSPAIGLVLIGAIAVCVLVNRM